jgi:hypothetical protein
MMGPQIMESWFRLMMEAMRGSTEAQEALWSLNNTSMSQDNMMRWMTQFMPSAASSLANPGQTQVFGEWIEQWWRMMGVVPRYRYLDALERNENLRIRLEECEKSRKMPGLPGMTEQTEEAQKTAMNLWGSMVEDTLKMQSEWMRNWVPAQAGSEETGPAEGSKEEGKEKKEKE